MGHRRDGTNVERLGVGTVHRIARAEQAPVQILDLSAHAAISEVDEHGATIAVDQNVVRLDVTVHDAGHVRGMQCLGNLSDDRHGGCRRQSSGVLDTS